MRQHREEVSGSWDEQEQLKQILQTQDRIKARVKTDIQFGEAILLLDGRAVLFPRTINVIQGKAGVHKSRLAECVCAAMLKNAGTETEVLGFSRKEEEAYAVCYVDTERNLSEQLPYALQQIQMRAGYLKTEEPAKFSYISLLEFEREKRFELLGVYVEHMKRHVQKNLLIVLDVVTDCTCNFNDSKDSMRLIDLMNRSINEQDVTFLCLIHENPGGGRKARGHLGTELINKSSTVLQIGFVRDQRDRETELIRICFLKCRNSKKHQEIYARYDEQGRGLVRAGEGEIPVLLRSRHLKAEHQEIAELLSELPAEGMKRGDLLHWIEKELQCGKRTVIKRLKDLMEEGVLIQKGGQRFELGSRMEERALVYFLSPQKRDTS